MMDSKEVILLTLVGSSLMMFCNLSDHFHLARTIDMTMHVRLEQAKKMGMISSTFMLRIFYIFCHFGQIKVRAPMRELE